MDSIAGVSAVIRELKSEALKAAGNSLPVLITGESGTGKELFAQAIHHASSRNIHPFMRIDCSAIPKDLLESELFGYEGGAFTGARSQGKPGKFELADHGSVFLDEIGDMPLEMQPKLLRVLEEKEFERVGGNTLIRSDFRLIAATNQDLGERMEEGKFRKDLFYRLNVIPLHIPPLRERREDIVHLAEHILREIASHGPITEIKMDAKVQRILEEYDWPGNVRELSNVLERAAHSIEGDTIRVCDLPFYIYGARKSRKNARRSLKEVQRRAEKDALRYALEICNYNKSQAAEFLGIHRTLLYKKLRKYGLSLHNDSGSA